AGEADRGRGLLAAGELHVAGGVVEDLHERARPGVGPVAQRRRAQHPLPLALLALALALLLPAVGILALGPGPARRDRAGRHGEGEEGEEGATHEGPTDDARAGTPPMDGRRTLSPDSG